MKVLYTIFTHSHGKGGHYFSFDTILRSLSKNLNFSSLEIGWNKSPVIEPDYYVPYSPLNILKTIKTISKVVKNEGISHIHCFDSRAFFICKIVAIRHNIPVYLTRCGGPNPKKYYPIFSNIFCFSKENADYFLASRRNIKVNLIPNRCEKLYTSNVKLNIDNDISFISIARIGHEYFNKHAKSIQLIRKLSLLGIKPVLYIVGTVEDQSKLKELEALAFDLPVFFLTEDKYTRKASDLIGNFNYVIGTGRGCMEAMSLGKVVLCVSNDMSLPFIVKTDNFHICLDNNFSLRIPRITTDDSNIADIENVINTPEVYEKLSNNNKQFFADYFDVDECYSHYVKVYENETGVDKLNISIIWDLFLSYLHSSYYYLKLRK
ncbi:hypothetical protein LRP52_32735 [Photobacterium sp. ZSDE20]|uniref:Glycosyl transferase family 1 domain-containing protein n=1 Tax=Photobacterium pectinilyticum TaxID=2906793 RepID=A0ABT1N5M0_9GAMM|nr:hypothetical protein [Photobacterium sp. ZSDE20]MCQ1060025.1 hypothetical protein [Photobacterium sp. ZSDE20]MDD1826952.1 hypothetical protein [Photobacterium sp. ZSDE20]